MSDVKVFYPTIKHGGPNMKQVESDYELMFDQADKLYVRLEDYAALKQSYMNLNFSLSIMRELSE